MPNEYHLPIGFLQLPLLIRFGSYDCGSCHKVKKKLIRPLPKGSWSELNCKKMINMVEVFKTNVQEVAASTMLIQKLLDRFQADRISFDLEDCDRVLRVEGKRLSPDQIISLITSHGYQCEILL